MILTESIVKLIIGLYSLKCICEVELRAQKNEVFNNRNQFRIVLRATPRSVITAYPFLQVLYLQYKYKLQVTVNMDPHHCIGSRKIRHFA